MAIFDLFSKRQAKVRGDLPDVFQYEEMRQELRVQIVHILRESLGNESEALHGGQVAEAYEYIVESLCREYGVFTLATDQSSRNRNYIRELWNYVLCEPNVERVLDAVELSFRVIDKVASLWDYRRHHKAREESTEAIEELNARFLQWAFGYRFEEGWIIRIDSELMHSEVVKPALALLQDSSFEGAEAEFHKAYEHYRHGRMKEALNECLKSMESTIKTIADSRDWKYPTGATAKPLLDLMFEKGLVPQLWAQHFSGIRASLESGVPTARNKMGGHGQGKEVVEVPDHYVAFVLHQTAAIIIFLAKANANFE